MPMPSAGRTEITGSRSNHQGAAGRGAVALWGIVLLGAVLRLLALGQKSFWLDEIASVTIARRPSPVFWHFLWHDEGNMALYYVLLKPWLHFGFGEGIVRLMSVLPGIASIPLMYLLGKRLFGREAGMLAALLLAVSTCAISVSQEARSYAYVVLLVLLATYLFVRLLERPSYGLAVAYAVVAGLTCYFHYFGVLVPAAHAISIAVLPPERRPWKPLLVAWGVVVVLALPIVWLIHAQDKGHISWLQPPSWLELYHLGVFLAADGGKAVGAILLVFELVLAGFFLEGLRKAWHAGRADVQRWRYVLVASVVAAPVAITLLVSIVRPAFYHRFLIICLPGWLLMITLGALQISRRAWRIAAIASVCVLSLVTTVLLYSRNSEDWRGAVRYLIAHTRPEDRVLYYDSVGQFAGENYRNWLEPANAARPATIGIHGLGDEWQQIEGSRRIWLVLYRANPEDPGPRSIQHELSKKYAVTEVTSFPGITIEEFRAR